MEQTECPETSAYKIQKPRNYPEENIQQRYCTPAWESIPFSTKVTQKRKLKEFI